DLSPAPARSRSAGAASGVNSADSLPAGVAAVGGTQYRGWSFRIRSQGRREGEIKAGTTLVDVLRDAASDASSILAASTSRPEPRAPTLTLPRDRGRNDQPEANANEARIWLKAASLAPPGASSISYVFAWCS